MTYFSMGEFLWKVELASPNDSILCDQNGNYTLGVTDPNTLTVYLSSALSEDDKIRVLLHELGHCAIYSFGLKQDIERMVKPEWRDYAEEWICNYVADYARFIFESAYQVLGDIVWSYISNRMWVMR